MNADEALIKKWATDPGGPEIFSIPNQLNQQMALNFNGRGKFLKFLDI
jgi:hypothetical protein